MSQKFEMIKDYIHELDLRIVREDEKQEVFIVDNPENGIQNLIIDCAPPLVVLEQLIFEVKSDSVDLYKRLLQMNRTLIHGAFVLDEKGKNVFFRDTLQLENLDLNELEGSVGALSLALAENGNELLDFAKK
jgi:hypothetical protein